MNPVYLDYAATTPVAPEVASVMARCLGLDGVFANPASRSHVLGWEAEQTVEEARRHVADLLGCDPREVIWTSGATEANNLAIKGIVEASGGSTCHIVTSAYEHKAVLDTCAWLERRGHRVTRVMPASDGTVSVQTVLAALEADTSLVSIMHVNNELGTVNDITGLGAALAERGVLFHVDAAQSVGKLPFDLRTLPVDLMSLSAHKFYGPKGAGALFVRRRPGLAVAAQMHGGGHERGMRSGTLPTHQLAGMGEAARLAMAQLDSDRRHIDTLGRRLLEGLLSIPGAELNGTGARWPGIINVSFAPIDAETLLTALGGLAISSGSACNSASMEPSYVLTSLGVSRARASSALRFSVGRYTTVADVEAAVDELRRVVQRLMA
jgi:cysteine desulfurase